MGTIGNINSFEVNYLTLDVFWLVSGSEYVRNEYDTQPLHSIQIAARFEHTKELR